MKRIDASISLLRPRGFSLIEVLVALFVFAVSVLGLAAFQVRALKTNQTAAARSEAVYLAYEITDSMRANKKAALAGNYDIALNATTPTGTSVDKVDVRNWLTDLSNQLPGGTGSIARNGSLVTVRVRWDESRLNRLDGATTQSFVFVTQL